MEVNKIKAERPDRISSEMTPETPGHDVTTPSDPILQPDGGWGWVVCLTCLVTNGVVFGVINSFGILYVAIREEYSQGSSNISFKAAWVGSLCTGLTLLLSYVAGVVGDSFGIRKTALFGAVVAFLGMLSSAFVQDLMMLYLTFGTLMGIGFACVYSLHLVIVGHYFKRRLGLAFGLVIAGGSVFSILLSFVLPELLRALGLQKTLMALSGFVVVLVPCASTWKALIPRRRAQLKKRQETGLTDSDEVLQKSSSRVGVCDWLSSVINTEVLSDKNFVLWAVAYSVCMMGYFVPLVHLVKHAEDVFSGEKGSRLLVYFGVSSTVGRLLVGKLVDLRLVKRRYLIQFVPMVIFGLCTASIPLVGSFGGLIGITVALGVSDGGIVTLMTPTVFDLAGEVNANQAMGLLVGMMSIPGATASPFAGYLYDQLGNYNLAFYLAGCLPVVAALMLLFVRLPRKECHTPTAEEHPLCETVEGLGGSGSASGAHEMTRKSSNEDYTNRLPQELLAKCP